MQSDGHVRNPTLERDRIYSYSHTVTSDLDHRHVHMSTVERDGLTCSLECVLVSEMHGLTLDVLDFNLSIAVGGPPHSQEPAVQITLTSN